MKTGMMRLVVVVVGILFLNVMSCFGSTLEYFSSEDADSYQTLLTNKLDQQPEQKDVRTAYHSLWSLNFLQSRYKNLQQSTTSKKQQQQIGISLEKLAIDQLSTTKAAQNIYYSLALLNELNSPSDKLPKRVFNELSNALTGDIDALSLADLYYYTSSYIILLGRNQLEQLSQVSWSSIISRVVALKSEDNAQWRRNDMETEGSVYETSLAYRILGNIRGIIGLELEQEDLDSIETVVDSSEETLSDAPTEESLTTLEFIDSRSRFSNLHTTSNLVLGLDSLYAHYKKKFPLTRQQVNNVASFFLLAKHVDKTSDAYYVLSALSAFVHPNFPTPIVLSTLTKTLHAASKGAEANLRVAVTDVFGGFATSGKAYLVASATADGSTVVSNQELQAVESTATNTVYQLNFLATKPDPGFYHFDFAFTPAKAEKSSDPSKRSPRFIPIESAKKTVKVISGISVTDFSLQVIDAIDGSVSLSVPVEFGKQAIQPVKVDHTQKIGASFRLKNSVTGRPVKVHQAFVQFHNSDATPPYSLTFVALPKTAAKLDYSLQLSLEESGSTFGYKNGNYTVTLLIGDAFLTNPTRWEVGTVQITFPSRLSYSNELRTEALSLHSTYVKPRSITHKFREPERLPSHIVSYLFTLLVLLPIPFLFYGFTAAGANMSDFPSPGKQAWFALGFQATIGALFGLLIIYWLYLNLFQTLTYLTILLIPTVLFGQQALYNLALRHSKQKTQ